MFPEFQVDFDVKAATILYGLAGSKSYGTDTPESDTDWKGILVPPKEYYFSPFKHVDQLMFTGNNEEGTIFALQKFFNLCSAVNPNIIELLYVDPQHLSICTEAGKLLRTHRDIFLSEKAGKTFCAYANSQLHRIELHRSYLMNPPKKKPVRENYGLMSINELKQDQYLALEAFLRRNLHSMAPWLIDANNSEQEAFWTGIINLLALYLNDEKLEYDGTRDNWHQIERKFVELTAQTLSFDSNFLEYVKKEKRFSSDLNNYEKYQHWVKTRNPSRAALEAKYGLDTKHSMHLVRLLRMGFEILTEGRCDVYRPDRVELQAIRNGQWSYQQLIDYSTELTDQIYTIIRENKAVVPKMPNYNKIEELNQQVLELHYAT